MFTDIQREKLALDTALEEFMYGCRARLHKRVDQGKRGWDDPEWAPDIVTAMYYDALKAYRAEDRMHLHDIANRAMMLWWQEWRVKKEKRVLRGSAAPAQGFETWEEPGND